MTNSPRGAPQGARIPQRILLGGSIIARVFLRGGAENLGSQIPYDTGLRIPRLPEIYRKPLSCGHLAITDKMLVPKGVRYRGVPLYSKCKSDSISTVYCYRRLKSTFVPSPHEYTCPIQDQTSKWNKRSSCMDFIMFDKNAPSSIFLLIIWAILVGVCFHC